MKREVFVESKLRPRGSLIIKDNQLEDHSSRVCCAVSSFCCICTQCAKSKRPYVALLVRRRCSRDSRSEWGA